MENNEFEYVGYYRAIVLTLPDIEIDTVVKTICPYCGEQTEFVYGAPHFTCQSCNQVTSVFKTKESRLKAQKYIEDSERFDAEAQRENNEALRKERGA
jgi:predicted aconitase